MLIPYNASTPHGEDAKDLDDAVSLSMDGENYVLGVHIADVSNYVQEHSALDAEALKRGTSVYLVDRVIPMLPHALSNGICSLNQGENRLALSCIMTVNPKGEIIDHEIAETVICVDRRMTYTNVKKILEDRDPEVIAEYEPLVPMFEKMAELAAILRKKRRKRGSIDFDFPETRVILDDRGNPVDIRPYERNVATKMIEDFMLAANETVAAIKAAGGDAVSVRCNVSDFTACQEMIESLIKEYKHMDILVNNAGITRDDLLMRMKESDFDAVINTNLKGTFNTIRHLSRYLLKQRAGKIINISSVSGILGNAGQSNYAASKAGVIGLTKSVARELASRGICVNAVAPGFVETEMTAVLPEKTQEELKKQIPLGRAGQVQDIAHAVAFLASPESDYITGQILSVDGGMAI